MKYTLTVNQKQALELGISNINQAIILGLIADAHSWAEPEVIDGVVYFWTARQKIADELAILNLKPDSVYRHLKALAELGLIEYVKNGKKDCVKLTKKGKSYYVGNESELSENSEINPSKFGNESEKHSEINPTYKNTNLIRATRDNIPNVIDLDLFDDFLEMRKTLKAPNTERAVNGLLKKLSEFILQGYNPNEIIQTSYENGWKSFFKPKQQYKPVDNTPKMQQLDPNVNIFDVIEAKDAQTQQAVSNG